MSKVKVPIVAIVGRANVGKSSLFNLLIGKQQAIVAREAGTTRDSVTGKVSIADKDFWLTDTAGLKSADDEFEASIQEQITQAVDSADMIMLVIEADVMINDEDRQVAKIAHKSQKPLMLVVNKVDKARRAKVADYVGLGIKDIHLVSTTTRQGAEELAVGLTAKLPKAKIIEDDDTIRIAILGRPNVGKSALFNALSKKQQAIVANLAGTTRDVNRTIIRYHSQPIELLDTAGIRRSGKIEVGIEKFSVLRTLAAIEEADICLLLTDANELSTSVDQKIAGMVKESGKGLVLVVSKWDTIEKDPKTADYISARLTSTYDFVPWAPMIFTSSVTGQNVTKLFDLFVDISKVRSQKIKTTALNRWLQNVIIKHPPAGLKNSHPKLNYMVQNDESTPNFKIYGSHLGLLHWSYKRYMERELRQEFGFDGTAIKMWFINKTDRRKTED